MMALLEGVGEPDYVSRTFSSHEKVTRERLDLWGGGTKSIYNGVGKG